MKSINFIMLVIFCLPAFLSAQSDKVLQVYSSAELKELDRKNPDETAYLTYKAEHCYFVQDLSGKKDISDLPDVSQLNQSALDGAPTVDANTFSGETFNVLYYPTSEKTTQYYRVGASGVLLRILSEESCRKAFNKSVGK